MVWPGIEVSRYIMTIERKQIQPNGVDLTLGEVYIFQGIGVLGEERVLPQYKKLEPDGEGFFFLKPGAYLVRYGEVVRIPKNAIGLVFPRSSLQRMGATIYTSVWDSGYEGRGVGLLVVFNPNGIRIRKGARICQIIYIEAQASGEYSGKYKYEGISG